MKIDKRKVIYLAGAIEHAKDDGRNWRRSIQNFLEEKGYRVLNPVTEETKALQAHDAPKDWQSFKHSNIEEYKRIMRKIIDFDMDIVKNKAGAVVVKWDGYAQKGAGTMAELTESYLQKIPVIMIHDIPLDEVPGWLIGTVDVFFSSLKAFKEGFDGLLKEGD